MLFISILLPRCVSAFDLLQSGERIGSSDILLVARPEMVGCQLLERSTSQQRVSSSFAISSFHRQRHSVVQQFQIQNKLRPSEQARVDRWTR